MTVASPLAAPPRSSLVGNAGAVVAAEALGVIVPLMTVPYLARVLGPDGWGPVLAAQALSNWLILIFQYGFDLSATRAIARNRSTAHQLEEIVSGVLSAKLLLMLGITPLVLVGFALWPSTVFRPVFAWGIAFAVLRGLSPLWFFQGIERAKTSAVIDASSRLLAAIGVLVLVRTPFDGWKVLALQAVFAAVALAVLWIWLARHTRVRRPQLAAGVRTLRDGASIFAARAWSSLYIQANTVILSVLAAPTTVAFFGGTERLIRAGINILQPITQAVLPRMSYLQASEPQAAVRVLRQVLLLAGLFGIVVGSVVCGAATLIVRLMLGVDFLPAVPILRVLAWLPLLVAVNTVLGIYWALPFGREKTFLTAVVCAGATNVVLAVVLVPLRGGLGMAVSAVAAEVIVLAVLGVAYARRAS